MSVMFVGAILALIVLVTALAPTTTAAPRPAARHVQPDQEKERVKSKIGGGCMGTVAQKHLDWIERAPVSFSGSVTTTASPQAVFAILADHERWPDWFPLLKKQEVLGPRREGVGIRACDLPRRQD